MAKRHIFSGLNIFWRMTLGYLVVIFLVVAISAYSILSLNKINRLGSSILSIDEQVIDLEKKMADSLLAQAQNEQKYLVTHDESYLNLYLSQRQAFTENFARLAPLLTSPEELTLKEKIQELFALYSSRVEELINPPSASSYSSSTSFTSPTSSTSSTPSQPQASTHRPAPSAPSAPSIPSKPVSSTSPLFLAGDRPPEIIAPPDTDPKALVDELTACLEKMIALRQSIINSKMVELQQMVSRSAFIIQTLVVASLVLGVILAFFITRSISRPLRQIEKMTEYIGQMNFDYQLDVHSPRELAQLAQSFSQMADRLKEIDEMKNNFISHVSHELRTPLTSINEASDLLLDRVGGELTSRQEHLLQIIKQCTQRLIKMVNNLLDLSKMEAGMMNYEFVRASINQIIRHSLEEINLLAKKKNIRLQVQIEDNLPPLKMDVEKMQEVMDNLLSNAIKFTPEGGTVRIEARLARKKDRLPGAQETSYLVVSVSDTGPGIPRQYQARIFEKFQGIDTRRTAEGRGTGLGLSIASHIVKAHGGKIWVESTEGQGSTFSFSLPLSATDSPSRPSTPGKEGENQ
ncbi:MAG TPA: ATP-binding protein [Candidatus Saccharicenans sp.]|nr:ATP-binding protein [Candidatus Saccharicenans sp.]